MSAPDFSTSCLAIAYRPDLDQLTGRWQQSVTDEELLAGYQAMRRAALHHHCRYWLVDARRRVNRRHNGPEQITTHFLPQVQQELGGLLAVCFLVLPSHLAGLAAQPASSGPLRYTRFLDEGAANLWLAGQQG